MVNAQKHARVCEVALQAFRYLEELSKAREEAGDQPCARVERWVIAKEFHLTPYDAPKPEKKT